MIINSKIKNTSDAIDYLNRAVFGEDPETSVLTRVYEGSVPIQDRVTAVENSAALVDVQALKDKVDELSNLTEIIANLAFPMPNLVVNGDFSNGSTRWVSAGTTNAITITDKIIFNGLANSAGGYYQDISSDNSQYYISLLNEHITGNKPNLIYDEYGSFANLKTLAYQNGFNSYVITNNGLRIYMQQAVGKTYNNVSFDNIITYNVSQMKLKGIKDDNGTPFTLLTDAQIKTQLDLWVQTRFPLDVLLMMRS